MVGDVGTYGSLFYLILWYGGLVCRLSNRDKSIIYFYVAGQLRLPQDWPPKLVFKLYGLQVCI